MCKFYPAKMFSPGPPVSSTNKYDRHDITEILLKVVRFIGGGNQRTRRKPPTCRKSLKNFIT
jgi:hypothetical protein